MLKRSRLFGVGFVLVFLIVVLFISVYTFVLQQNFSKNLLESAIVRDTACSDAIHRLVSNSFTREDYEGMGSISDMQTDRYMEIQQQLNKLRSLNFVRYLYTAKRNDDGKLIYLVDGLDLGAEDFAFPGTYIEEEMIPYIEAALSGETVYSQEIVDTTWGHIFTACYPVRATDGTNDIIGALCIEIDIETTYHFLEMGNKTTIRVAIAAGVVLVLLTVAMYLFMRRQHERKAEQQVLLKETAAAADAANRAKSSFLFNMSHDIRTPMNAIIGYANLADKYIDSPEQLRPYLDNIRTCGQKMLSIIDNVLELSRIENGSVSLEETAVESGSVFDSCVVMVQSEIDRKQQKLTVSKEILYPYVYLDVSRVSEIVLNLVGNAIKYMGDGGEIHCDIRQIPNERAGWCTLKLAVRDNGIGMSKEFQEHVFESFSRERSSTVSGIEGSGLGMGIVKKLVDLMGGDIQIQSKLGEGSTFTVYIPCRIAHAEDTQAKRADKPTDKEIFKCKRLLLAEDNDLNAEIATELLSEVGLIVDRAENGVRCLDMLEKAPNDYYKAVLMDVQMPVLDGYCATEKIRELEDKRKANIPIIAMTANAFAEDKAKALDVGMDDHIAKPIDMNKLLSVLGKYMGE